MRAEETQLTLGDRGEHGNQLVLAVGLEGLVDASLLRLKAQTRMSRRERERERDR